MSEEFDPYQQWLGISPRERPVDHYRLLGLAHFEANSAIIAQAADERMTMVRSYQTGPRGAHTQKLLNDISTARLCLLNADTKSMYDAVLQGRFAAAVSRPAPEVFPPGPGVMLPPATAPLAMPLPTAGFRSPTAFPVSIPAGTFANSPLALPAGTLPAIPPPVRPPIPAPHVVTNPIMTAPDGAAELSDSRSMVRGRIIGAVVLLVAVTAAWMVLGRPFGKREPTNPPATSDGTGDSAIDADASAAASPKSPAEPVLIEQEGSGQINFAPSTAKLHGDALQLEVRGDESVIGHWTSADEWLSWRFHLGRPGIFRVDVQYTAAEDADGGKFELILDDDEAKAGDIRATPGDKLNTEVLFLAVKRSGTHALVLRPKSKPGEEFMTLKTIRFEPQ